MISSDLCEITYNLCSDAECNAILSPVIEPCVNDYNGLTYVKGSVRANISPDIRQNYVGGTLSEEDFFWEMGLHAFCMGISL
ncbi:hypothetical protein CEXT_785621 [Caerostris extrusa]|uniref:Uncharacterized protein n=1 Tax=Caerostris extrusa TaxID=172846 RepID=A0AAV4MJV7_CAEEX|nr:hypothetical protein CEXT_785621 [Caerostris extrusa]